MMNEQVIQYDRDEFFSAERKRRTNYDLVRTMSIEELAEWLVHVETRIIGCMTMLERPPFKNDWIDWLKKPCEEK